MLAEIERDQRMDDTRIQDLTQTQPLQTVAAAPRSGLSRHDRLLRTVVFGVAILIGIVTVIVIGGDNASSPPAPSGIFSPSGHLPSTPNGNKNVSMSWSAVNGAAGYWWAMVEDPARLPTPVIRPSGADRRVFFRFSGRGYFVLRAALRSDGKLRWSEETLYGPIVIRDKAIPGVENVSSTDLNNETTGSASGASGNGESGPGGSGGSSGSSRPRATVDPRYAGEPGECPSGGGGCGQPGQPGQPAPEAGGGGGAGRSGCTDCPGTQGPNGADGPPG